MSNKSTIYRDGNSGAIAHFALLPDTAELDLREVYEISESCYHKDDHIEQESEFVPALHRWSDRFVP